MKKLIFTTLLCVVWCVVNAQDAGLLFTPSAFKGEVTQMIPSGYPAKQVQGNYSIQVLDGKVTVHMPYVGDVHTLAFDENGLNFTEECSGYRTKVKTKKKTNTTETEVIFRPRHAGVSYEFRVTLYNNNTFHINLSPSNASACNYAGRLVKMEK